MAQYEQWAGFKGRNWTHSVDVRSFIQDNYTPYEGDDLRVIFYRYEHV